MKAVEQVLFNGWHFWNWQSKPKIYSKNFYNCLGPILLLSFWNKLSPPWLWRTPCLFFNRVIGLEKDLVYHGKAYLGGAFWFWTHFANDIASLKNIAHFQSGQTVPQQKIISLLFSKSEIHTVLFVSSMLCWYFKKFCL